MYTRSGNTFRGRSNNNYRTQRGSTKNRISSYSTQKLLQTIGANRVNNSVTAEVKKTPIHASFNAFNINEQIKRNLAYKKYTAPTPIQDETITPILEGRDIIGIANTGTGKTAAFLIPLIHKVALNRNEKVLIIAPTRELALQINDEFQSFSAGMHIFATLCIGGTNLYRQRNELRRNANFLIGTPGRIKDMVNSGNLNLSYFRSVVLDEADRMVDIGFIGDIKYFISLLPKERQSLFFSATIGNKESEIIREFVTNPITVSVRTQQTSTNVKQDLIKVVDKTKKVDQLHDLLINKEVSKTLIFGRTKWGIEKLTHELIKRGFKADSIHGNKTQAQRQRAIDRFKRNEVSILLATDIASRGIDIKDISHVINYDLPATYEDYIHRIGRTGRANSQGIALTFVE